MTTTTSLDWVLMSFLIGWQYLAKLSLSLTDQYSSTWMIYPWHSPPNQQKVIHLLAQFPLLKQQFQLLIDCSTRNWISLNLEFKERAWHLCEKVIRSWKSHWQDFMKWVNLNIRRTTSFQYIQELLRLCTWQVRKNSTSNYTALGHVPLGACLNRYSYSTHPLGKK